MSTFNYWHDYNEKEASEWPNIIVLLKLINYVDQLVLLKWKLKLTAQVKCENNFTIWTKKH